MFFLTITFAQCLYTCTIFVVVVVVVACIPFLQLYLSRCCCCYRCCNCCCCCCCRCSCCCCCRFCLHSIFLMLIIPFLLLCCSLVACFEIELGVQWCLFLDRILICNDAMHLFWKGALVMHQWYWLVCMGRKSLLVKIFFLLQANVPPWDYWTRCCVNFYTSMIVMIIMIICPRPHDNNSTIAFYKIIVTMSNWTRWSELSQLLIFCNV